VEDTNFGIIQGIPQAITVGVLILNFILKKWIISGVWLLRPSSDSVRIGYTTIFMAFSFFINTGLIPIITGADFSKLTELIFGTNSTIYY